MGCLSVIWRSEGGWRGTQGHGYHGEGLSGPLCAPLAWPDSWGAEVGQGSTHDSRVVWTLAGLRCLKHLRNLKPALAALAGSLRIWLKTLLLRPGPWSMILGTEGGLGPRALVPGQELWKRASPSEEPRNGSAGVRRVPVIRLTPSGTT